MDLGVNFLIASGFTGQTIEVLALPADLDGFERVVGVRIPSYVSVSYTYHFRPPGRRQAKPRAAAVC